MREILPYPATGEVVEIIKRTTKLKNLGLKAPYYGRVLYGSHHEILIKPIGAKFTCELFADEIRRTKLSNEEYLNVEG